MKTLKELVRHLHAMIEGSSRSLTQLKLSNDPSLMSLPLLTTFLKYFSRPYMGLTPPAAKQISPASEPGSLSSSVEKESPQAQPINEEQELVEKDIRDRFKKMCEGYFDSVSRKLLVEHNVGSLSFLSTVVVYSSGFPASSRTGQT